ncbi:MAG: hypothetical protein Q8S84_08555 [bacterium]|nr:hypothetical protein [bacterium]MDP3381482.1 hypothetical protein [bacterium]
MFISHSYEYTSSFTKSITFQLLRVRVATLHINHHVGLISSLFWKTNKYFLSLVCHNKFKNTSKSLFSIFNNLYDFFNLSLAIINLLFRSLFGNSLILS